VVVSCVLIVWQLYARHGESLGPERHSVPQADVPSLRGA